MIIQKILFITLLFTQILLFSSYYYIILNIIQVNFGEIFLKINGNII